MSGAARGVIRLARAWRSLSHAHRLAAGGAAALFVTLFLPWYHETVVSARHAASASVTGWGAFSFVEAVVLLVAAGVLLLMFWQGEGRGIRLPTLEGGVIIAAGAFTFVLVIWRMIDKPTFQLSGTGTAISGVDWGIFVALAMAAFVAYAGNRIRTGAASAGAARGGRAGQAAPDEQPTGDFEPVSVPLRTSPPRRPRRRRYGVEQLTIPLDERDSD
jgi:hypothetical protein